MGTYINADDALSRLNNNKKLYLMLLKKFNGNELLNDLVAKLGENNVKDSTLLAHTIKGLAANLSMPDLRAEAEKIEQKLKSGESDISTDAISASVENTVNSVKAYIAENS